MITTHVQSGPLVNIGELTGVSSCRKVYTCQTYGSRRHCFAAQHGEPGILEKSKALLEPGVKFVITGDCEFPEGWVDGGKIGAHVVKVRNSPIHKVSRGEKKIRFFIKKDGGYLIDTPLAFDDAEVHV